MEVRPELLVALVVVPLDGRILEGPVHPLDLPIGPRVVGLCQAVLVKAIPQDGPLQRGRITLLGELDLGEGARGSSPSASYACLSKHDEPLRRSVRLEGQHPGMIVSVGRV